MTMEQLSEKDKMLRGELYDANYNEELIAERNRCKTVCQRYNSLPYNTPQRGEVLRGLFGRCGENFTIEPSFWCDYGYNIFLGENFYANHNLVILDEAPVTIGDNVFMAPNCGIYTSGHPLDVEQRNKGLEYARPVTIGNNVWIGANVVIVPGVTIGEGSTIGAGSVVVKDIPAHCVAVGNPCRVIKKLK